MLTVHSKAFHSSLQERWLPSKESATAVGVCVKSRYLLIQSDLEIPLGVHRRSSTVDSADRIWLPISVVVALSHSICVWYVCFFVFGYVFICFHTIPACDGWTDRATAICNVCQFCLTQVNCYEFTVCNKTNRWCAEFSEKWFTLHGLKQQIG